MKKRVVITGATGGIGKVVLEHLIERGYIIYAGCRNFLKLSRYKEYKYLNIIELDMESLNSVVSFCNKVIEELNGEQIDILINNAGMIAPAIKRSADGYESSLQVNYIAPKLLTESLVNYMKPQGKVINTLSCTISSSHFVNVQKLDNERGESTISSLKHYSNAKYMFALQSVNLADEHPSLNICVVDPGIVNTGIITMHRWYDPLANLFFRPFIKSSKQGAKPIINAIESSCSGLERTQNGGNIALFKGNKVLSFKKYFAPAPKEKEVKILF